GPSSSLSGSRPRGLRGRGGVRQDCSRLNWATLREGSMRPRQTFRGVVLKGTARPGKPPRAPQQRASGAGAGPARVVVGRQVAGRGGKAVSVISGLPLDEAQLAELATRLKRSEERRVGKEWRGGW